MAIGTIDADANAAIGSKMLSLEHSWSNRKRIIVIGDKTGIKKSGIVGRLFLISRSLLFSGFKNRFQSTWDRNHPRNLKMVTLMMSVVDRKKIKISFGGNVIQLMRL